MMDKRLTEQLAAWLNASPDERDYDKGNDMLLRFTRNTIQYNNLARLLPRDKAKRMIDYQLQKFYKARVQDITHEEVEQMQSEVDKCLIRLHSAEQASLSALAGTNVDRITSFITEDGEGTGEAAAADNTARMGKRADHDTLPDEIKALYIENLDLMHRIRQNKLELNQMVLRNTTCPDSDRYPFLKEIIKLDKQMRANWYAYDHYVPGTKPAAIVPASASDDDARAQSVKANGTINLLKGRYKKAPSEELKEKILAQYRLIINPTEKLTDSLKELGILE